MGVKGRKEHGLWEGMCGGEEGRKRGALMTEAVPFLSNLLPFWAAVSVSLGTGFGLFRVHEGRDKTAAFNTLSIGMKEKKFP